MSEMSRVIDCLREGLCPSQISKQTRIPIGDVIFSLKEAVHDGKVKRSEILYSFPKEIRAEIDLYNRIEVNIPQKVQLAFFKEVTGMEMAVEEIELYLHYRGKKVHIGDLYELICGLERTLHSVIRKVLIREYGSSDSGWWRQGVPESVRVACVEARERDAEYDDDPYSYTTFIHLKDILDKQWKIFAPKLPADTDKNKPQLMEKLKRLNTIRNRVMHPVRGEPPSDTDYEFVAELSKLLSLSQWRLKPKTKP